MTRRLRGVLFDMDDTLFDHNHATVCATAALYAEEGAFGCWTPDELRRRHSLMLEVIHEDVLAGRLQIDEARRERFRRLLLEAGASARALDRAPVLAKRYRTEYELGWRPVAGAVALLAALKARGTIVGIVTNNVTSEQVIKLDRCGLAPHVDALITSEDAGIQKPDPRIFALALQQLGLTADETAMVGDVWRTDITGAQAAGVWPVWFNWRGLPDVDAAVAQVSALEPVEAVISALGMV
jgi:HAD superfamily hydrolase (TIGR01549 family)